MAYINETDIYNSDGVKTGKKIIITGNPPWKMRVVKVKDNGERLQFWRANNDDDLVEWIKSLIGDNELNDETKAFIIEEDGKDRETIGEYCKRNKLTE